MIQTKSDRAKGGFATKPCPVCGNLIEEKTITCPFCGMLMEPSFASGPSTPDAKSRQPRMTMMVILSLVFVIAGAGMAFYFMMNAPQKPGVSGADHSASLTINKTEFAPGEEISVEFTAPAQTGDYDLRMHETDNNGVETASVSFQVR